MARKNSKTKGSRKRTAENKPSTDAALRKHLVELLQGGGAHIGISEVLADFPADKRGAAAQGLPHTAWQLLEHIRIAQWDILEFSRNPKHVSPSFPDGYWPKSTAAPDHAAWEKSIQSVESDLRAMLHLVSDPQADLCASFPWGDGQTLLREALLVADHNAYHVGQIVDLRRALGIWGKS
jgi:DinB superfamily